MLPFRAILVRARRGPWPEAGRPLESGFFASWLLSLRCAGDPRDRRSSCGGREGGSSCEPPGLVRGPGPPSALSLCPTVCVSQHRHCWTYPLCSPQPVGSWREGSVPHAGSEHTRACWLSERFRTAWTNTLSWPPGRACEAEGLLLRRAERQVGCWGLWSWSPLPDSFPFGSWCACVCKLLPLWSSGEQGGHLGWSAGGRSSVASPPRT